MKSLLAIFQTIFQKCEDEKISLIEEGCMLYQAAEEYVETLQKNNRWEYIIKMDIDDLKASSQMQQNYINNAHEVDSKAADIVARYIMRVDILLSYISHEMERYGLVIDDKISGVIVPETGNNGSLNIGDNSGENEKVKLLTTNQIKEKINKIEPFLKVEANDDIPFGKYWTKLTKGVVKQANGDKKEFHVIDDERCNFELFCLCVERADISDIIKDGNMSIARLFMYYVADRFKDSGKYKKAAEKTFGLHVRLSAVPSKYRAEFYQLLGDEFPDSEPIK